MVLLDSDFLLGNKLRRNFEGIWIGNPDMILDTKHRNGAEKGSRNLDGKGNLELEEGGETDID